MQFRSLILFFLLSLPLLFHNCAQVAQPPGGKKDTIAPKLVRSVPTNRQLNYTGKTVELEFDEYVNTENIQQKVTITPQDSNTFLVRSQPQGIRLTFDKPLQPNTTYTIDFADAIKDITERNIAANTKVVFSTGPAIDSLGLSGTVVDDESRRPILGFLVGLFLPTDTLPIQRKRPQYFARTDSNGNYRIENVKVGQYRVYGFDDKDLNLVNNTQGERVAFRDSILNLNRNYEGINLVAFRNTGKPRITRRERTDETLGLELNTGIASYRLRYGKPGDTLVSFLESPTLIRLFRPADRAAADTIPLTVIAQDSAGNPTELRERVYFSPLKSRAKNRQAFAVQIVPAPGEPLDPNLEFTLTFNRPVGKFNPELVSIYADSTKPVPLTGENFTWSNSYGRLVIRKPVNLRDSLFLRLEKGAFISVQGDTVARVKNEYTLADEESFGLIAGRINPSTVAQVGNKYIVELLDEKNVVVRSVYGPPTYSFGRLKPGRYRVRLILDLNGNRRRDSGNIQKMLQPEPIIYHPGGDEDGFILVKQNFELTDTDF